jgi:hypothetical protein
MTFRSAVAPALAGALLLSLGVAVWQHLSLRRLRAQQVGLSQQERAALQERIWKAEDRGAKLEKELAEARSVIAASPAPAPGAAAAGADRSARPARGPGDVSMITENPVFQRALNLQQRSALDARYSALFRSLRLGPEQLERLKSLLLDKQNVPLDVLSAARSGGPGALQDRSAITRLMSESTAEVDAALRESLGEAGYAEYQRFEQTLPQRQLVEQLSQRLSYSDAPLNDVQSEQLIRILAETAPKRPAENAVTQALTFSLGGSAASTVLLGGAAVAISDEAVARSQGVLAPSQIVALRELQARQQAQIEAQEAMRKGIRPGIPAVPLPGSRTAPPAPGGARPPP